MGFFFTKKPDTPNISPVSSTYNLRERKTVNYADTSDDSDDADERVSSSDE